MSNFSFSPGLLGYGASGSDGSLGLQGMALYFTDFDESQNQIEIMTRIRNNWVLFSNSAPGTILTNGRTYSEGDLFINSRGYVYRITDPSNGTYEITDGAFSKITYLELSNPIVSAEGGFTERWLNKNSSTDTKYIIDNNFSSRSNYLYPSKVYGISLKNFTRIEYTDGSAFSIFKTGQEPGMDDHKSLALVRDNNSFKLGNTGTTLRNTNLTFDVSLLTSNRQNNFDINTPIGTILTKSEKNVPLILDPNFIANPSSFTMTPDTSSCLIEWDLRDFSDDPCINGTIIFSKKQSLSGVWDIDASVFRPLIFHQVDVSGALTITDLSIGTTYQYQMIISKDGWERNSSLNEIVQS